MLTVYRRLGTIGQALKSVLDQARAPEQMQIEVISDRPADPIDAELEALVRTLGGSRVQFYAHPERAGHPEIFNVCLRRARGEWIHILHDDDWVEPGFYDALDEGARIAGVGAAFCRHHHVDRQGRVTRLSALERESAGVIDGWVDRVATLSRVQAASMVVRRAAYEQVGGYCAQARSAFDWEMWQRISVHFHVWFEPRALAWFRESDATETARLTASGAQIADTLAAIEVAQGYLPAEVRERLRWRAREMYALLAIDAAQARWLAGDAAGTLANLREAAQCSESGEVTNKMRALLDKM
jgi:glycosyltransferase involved in cell wall biosynthesis